MAPGHPGHGVALFRVSLPPKVRSCEGTPWTQTTVHLLSLGSSELLSELLREGPSAVRDFVCRQPSAWVPSRLRRWRRWGNTCGQSGPPVVPQIGAV